MSNKLINLLNEFTKEELINIIDELSQQYKELEDVLIMKYAVLEVDDEIKKNKEYLSKVTRKYGNGRRFVTWGQCGNYAYEVMELLSNSRQYSEELGKPAVAVETSLNIIHAMIKAIQYMDDSNGDIGNVVDSSLYLIDDMCIHADEFSEEDKKRIFKKLLSEANKKVYDGWEEWRIEVLANCIYFCNDEKNRKKFEKKLDELYNSYEDGWSGNYNRVRITKAKLDMYLYLKDNESVEELLKENMHHPDIRERMLIHYRDLREFKKVIELAEDGEACDSDNRIYTARWKTYRYLANKELNNLDEMETLGRELFLKGNFKIFEDLKEMHKYDWKEYYLGLKEEFLTNGRELDNLYINMLLCEKDVDALIEVCRKDIRYIEDFANILIEDYKEEVEYIYRVYIERRAEVSNNRKQYKSVCKLIKEYKKLFGELGTVRIVKELKSKYIKRPAFIDELSKI